jgi:type II secretory pathway pseudopilin PulG
MKPLREQVNISNGRHGVLGLTLVEILVTVAIIAVLTTMVMTIVKRVDNQAKEKSLANTFAVLESALQEYYEYWNAFPDPNTPAYATHSAALYGQLQATPTARSLLNKVDEAYIKNHPSVPSTLQIHDPWGTVLDYRYVPSSNFPELMSAGPDEKFSTADDISSRKGP